MTELFGWVGGVTLSICALPQVYHTFKTKSTAGLSTSYLVLWLKGEIFTLCYLLINDFEKQQFQGPLYLNYTLNLIIAIYLVYAKIYYSKGEVYKKA